MKDMDADTKALCEQLQSIWYQQIPLSQAMQMRIADFDGQVLTNGKGRFPLTCQVLLADGNPAVQFSGDYAVRLNR